MGNLRLNDQRARIAVILIFIMFLMDIISGISGYFQYELLQIASEGGMISDEEANANDEREQIVGVIYLIIYIISGITFIQWFRRAYFNLHLKVDHLSHTEGWAAGAWFVPIVGLYRPYQIMKELYEETKSLLIAKGVSIKDPFTTDLLGIWWALWVINSLLGQFTFRYSNSAETIDELITVTVASMVSNLIGIPLALIAIKVVKDYAKVEPLLFEIKDDESNLTTEEITS